MKRIEQSTSIGGNYEDLYNDFEDYQEDIYESIEDFCYYTFEAVDEDYCREDVYEAYEALSVIAGEDAYQNNCDIRVPTPVEYDYDKVEDVEDFIQSKLGEDFGDWDDCYNAVRHWGWSDYGSINDVNDLYDNYRRL